VTINNKPGHALPAFFPLSVSIKGNRNYDFFVGCPLTRHATANIKHHRYQFP